MKQIGSEGTVYVWSTYELTMLRDVRRQMEETGHDDRELADWIDAIVSESGSRVVDLCALARQHYLHPDMKGSVSIKAVFPAVWRANPEVRGLACFRGLSHPSDPYKALPALPVGEDEDVVREGTGAIRAYQDMMFGLARGGQVDAPSLPANAAAVLRAGYRRDGGGLVALDATAPSWIIWPDFWALVVACHHLGHAIRSPRVAMKPLLAILLFLTAVSIARADLTAIENQYRAA